MTPPSPQPPESDSPIEVRVPAGITRELVARYIARCQAGLPSLRAAVERADFETARVCGHRMKGSGGAYGIPALSEIGAGVERMAKACDAAALQELVTALEACLSRLVVEPQPK